MAKEEQLTKAAAVANALPKASFDLSSFDLDTCTVEIRYPFALAIWDKAGELWKAVQEKWPDIVPLTADPKKTEFRVGKRRLTVEFEQARIIDVEPGKSLEQFFKDSREFVALTTRHLQISTYKRVGFRLLYFKECKDSTEAAAQFFSMGLVRLPDGKKFEIDEQPTNPQYVLRWESEKKGVVLSCRAETRVVNIEPPLKRFA